MSNIYIHFPFCKQACHYCNFHFSTSLNEREKMIFVIKEELKIRRKELTNPIESIYFGGGSPSLLKPYQLNDFIKFVIKQFEVDSKVEITLEVNPDDVDKNYLLEIKSAGVNRISLGVQSFFEKDLLLMNRAHNVSQVHNSIGWIKKKF